MHSLPVTLKKKIDLRLKRLKVFCFYGHSAEQTDTIPSLVAPESGWEDALCASDSRCSAPKCGVLRTQNRGLPWSGLRTLTPCIQG